MPSRSFAARIAVAGSLLALAGPALAKGLTSFQYQAGADGVPRNIYAVWNPRDRAPLFAPGMKVMFFGVAPACDGGGRDGRTAHPADARWVERAASLTGVTPGAPDLRWTPSGDSPGCPASARGAVGQPFVEMNPSTGIGLYTEAGPPASDGPAFFGVFGEGGQNGRGANRGIDGTFVGFRFETQGDRAIRPFDAGGADPAIRIQARLGVASVLARGGSAKEPVQADQHVAITLLNDACKPAAGHLCQFKYLFHTALYRDGVDDWSRVPWFQDANLFIDNAQGGVPVVQGPVGASGQVTNGRTVKLPMYRSMGSPTLHQPFADADFDIQVRFSQLRNALQMITTGKGAGAAGDAAISAAFGDRWQDPSSWILVDINLGQEISNHTPDRRAFIGGSVRRLAVVPDTSGP
jgi:hypothetical protein